MHRTVSRLSAKSTSCSHLCHSFCLGVKNAGPEKLLPVWEKSLASAEGLSCQQWTYSFGWLRLGTNLSGFISSLTLHEVLYALCVLIKRLSEVSVGSKELLANLIHVFLFIHFFPTINAQESDEVLLAIVSMSFSFLKHINILRSPAFHTREPNSSSPVSIGAFSLAIRLGESLHWWEFPCCSCSQCELWVLGPSSIKHSTSWEGCYGWRKGGREERKGGWGWRRASGKGSMDSMW